MQQHFGLPYEGVHHVLGLFMKSSIFTRYLLDDVLHKEVFNNRKIIEENLENVLEECETLMISLKTFKKLSSLLNFGEAVSVSCQNIQKKCDKENGYLPVKLLESFQVMESFLKLTKNFKQFQLYYCELCDESSFLIDEVKEHFASERHTSALLSSSNSFLTSQCKSCRLFIMATQSILNNIIESKFHSTVDSTFENLNLKLNDSNKQARFNSQLSIDTTESLSVSTDKNYEIVQGETSEHGNSELSFNNYEIDSQTSTSFKDKWFITDVFAELNDKMLSDRIGECFYCRPCDQVLMGSEEWYNHQLNQLHKKQSKRHKYFEEKCYHCSFHIFGPKPELNAYLRYHKDINHFRTFNSYQSKNNKKMSLNRKFENHKSKERNPNSSKRNSTYSKGSKCASKKNNLEQEQRIYSFKDGEQSIDENETILNRTYEVRPSENHRSISPSLPLFLEVIGVQRFSYKDSNLNSPIGACIPCFKIFTDEIDWIGHVKKFHENTGFIELNCEKCNISVYGPADVISNEIWNIREHQELDKFIN